MSLRTIYLSRLIGLYCILVDLSLVIHRQASVGSIVATFNNPAVMLTLGIATVAAGLALILAHNIWSGGAQTVVVTLVGWLALIKGLLFLALPAGVEGEIIVSWLRTPTCFYVCLAPSLLIGIYLTYGGFRTKANT
jgi:vacuolar-type H+-ATPase subunit I/STV1